MSAKTLICAICVCSCLVQLQPLKLFAHIIPQCFISEGLDDRHFGMVKKEIVGECESGNCHEGDIYITDRTITGNMYVTAKGANSKIQAGIIPLEHLCSDSTDSVCVAGLTSGASLDPESASYRLVADVDFRAGKEIRLTGAFKAEKGCRFHAYIAPQWDVEEPVWYEEFDYDAGDYNPNNQTHNAFAHRWKNVAPTATEDFVRFVDLGAGNTGMLVERSCTINGKGDVESVTADMQTYDQIHSASEPYGRWETRVKWAPMCVEEGQTGNRFVHSVWLIASDSYYFDEIDLYERNVGDINQCSIPPLACPSRSPHYAGYGALSWHNGWRHASTAGLDVDPSVNDMPRFDREFVVVSIEWFHDELRFLVNDCLVQRFPNRHTINAAHESTGVANYSFAKQTLKNPAAWLANIPGLSECEADREYSIVVDYLRVFDLKVN